MAGYRDVNSAAQTIRRNIQGVDFSNENRNALESVAVALAAGGRVNEFAVMMQSLEKVNSNMSVADSLKDVAEVLQQIKAQTAVETPVVKPTEPTEPGLEELQAEIDALKAQLGK